MSYAQFSIWLMRLVPAAAAVTNLIKIFLRILSERCNDAILYSLRKNNRYKYRQLFNHNPENQAFKLVKNITVYRRKSDISEHGTTLH